MGELFLLRHGETEWSKAGRHTGRTDLAADPHRARSRPGPPARSWPGCPEVRSSPRCWSARCSGPAGRPSWPGCPPPRSTTDLVEWDYGGYEGLTTGQIQAAGDPGWRIFHDGVVPGATPGESLEQVAERADRVVQRVRPALDEGNVALVGHGHALRVLATVWLGRPADLGQQLLLGSGAVCVLGAEHDVPAVRAWNATA